METSHEIDKGNLVPDLGGAQTKEEIPQSKKELMFMLEKFLKETISNPSFLQKVNQKPQKMVQQRYHKSNHVIQITQP